MSKAMASALLVVNTRHAGSREGVHDDLGHLVLEHGALGHRQVPVRQRGPLALLTLLVLGLQLPACGVLLQRIDSRRVGAVCGVALLALR